MTSEAIEHTQRGERSPQKLRFHALGATYAGVWLLMLAFPLVSTMMGDYSPTMKVIFIVINAAFAVAYLAGFGYYDSLIHMGRRDLIGWWMALCIALILSTTIIIGPYTVAYSPWLVALFVFPLPLRWGIPLTLATTILAITLTWILFTEIELRITFTAVSGGSALLITTIGIASKVADNRELLTKNLAVAKERENIARDVHDLLGHSLTVINLKAELAHKLVSMDPDAAQQELREISGLSRTALAEVRSTVTRLNRPDFTGEVLATQRALDTAGILANLPDAAIAQYIAGNNAHLYSWVLRETITNVVRHSRAKQCSVQMTPEKLQIVDDGSGWNGQYGGGLSGLDSRVDEAGGRLIITSKEGHGTSVLLSMSGDIAPLTESETAAQALPSDTSRDVTA